MGLEVKRRWESMAVFTQEEKDFLDELMAQEEEDEEE
jgi:hypothetical protein